MARSSKWRRKRRNRHRRDRYATMVSNRKKRKSNEST
nr:MAG TPA: hypothetical protein [Caudoviricetes sp.]